MTQAQKIIKYFALALAFFIIVSLVSGIFYGINSLINLFSDNEIGEIKTFEFKEANVENLDIELSSTKLIIKNSDYFKVETNNKYVDCSQTDNKITIKETKNNLFSKNGKSEVIVYINKNLNKVTIEAGAGNINIDNIEANELDFEMGAGKVNITNLNVFNKASINGGAGEVIIENGIINNLDLDIGVGKVSLTSKLTGFSDIDAGIGELNINLLDKIENYKIKIEKGLGKVKINGEEKNDGIYGEGNNSIEIDGGIGNINIKSEFQN